MTKAPEGMTILEVLPHNYDEILERSAKTQEPYTKEDLDRIQAQARSNNGVALVMFMDSDFWTQGEKEKK